MAGLAKDRRWSWIGGAKATGSVGERLQRCPRSGGRGRVCWFVSISERDALDGRPRTGPLLGSLKDVCMPYRASRDLACTVSDVAGRASRRSPGRGGRSAARCGRGRRSRNGDPGPRRPLRARIRRRQGARRDPGRRAQLSGEHVAPLLAHPTLEGRRRSGLPGVVEVARDVAVQSGISSRLPSRTSAGRRTSPGPGLALPARPGSILAPTQRRTPIKTTVNSPAMIRFMSASASPKETNTNVSPPADPSPAPSEPACSALLPPSAKRPMSRSCA